MIIFISQYLYRIHSFIHCATVNSLSLPPPASIVLCRFHLYILCAKEKLHFDEDESMRRSAMVLLMMHIIYNVIASGNNWRKQQKKKTLPKMNSVNSYLDVCLAQCAR